MLKVLFFSFFILIKNRYFTLENVFVPSLHHKHHPYITHAFHVIKKLSFNINRNRKSFICIFQEYFASLYSTSILIMMIHIFLHLNALCDILYSKKNTKSIIVFYEVYIFQICGRRIFVLHNYIEIYFRICNLY